MEDFAEQIAAPTPTPGGGAVAARVGLYAVSLLRMVIGITLKKLREAPAPHGAGSPSPGEGARALERLEEDGRELAHVFADLEREDMAAFKSYLDAVRLPRGTPEEKEARRLARARAALRATNAPLATLRAVRRLLESAAALVDLSKSTPLRAESDLAAAVELGHACARVAELNIQANLGELTETDRAAAVEEWRSLAEVLAARYARLTRTPD